jgi:hypothetical protein
MSWAAAAVAASGDKGNYVRPDCVGGERVPFYCIDSVVNRHVNHCEPDEPARRWHGGDGDDGVGRVPVPIKNGVRARDRRGPGDGKRKCDEKWQNQYSFKLSQWIHCCSFLLVSKFGFHLDKARKSDQSDHLNSDFCGNAFGVQELLGLGSV